MLVDWAPVVETITSRSNPLVTRFRETTRARRRGRTHLLLDGARLVSDALRSSIDLDTVVVSRSALKTDDPSVAALVRACAASNVSVVAAGERVLAAISRSRSPSRAVALAVHHPIGLEDLLARAVSSRGCVLAAAGVQDPGNVGAIVRATDAAGGAGVIVSAASADPFGDKALRGAMGSTFRVPVADAGQAGDVAARAARAGYRVVAALPHGGRSIYAIDLRPPTVILIGSEGAGIDTAVAEAAETTVSVPMANGVESLNVAVAAALIAYEARRQRFTPRSPRRRSE